MTRLQIRRGTAALWTSVNPVLQEGEPGLETDSGQFKFGDGSTVWTGLDYAGSGTDLTEDVEALSALLGTRDELPPIPPQYSAIFYFNLMIDNIGGWQGEQSVLVALLDARITALEAP